MSDSTKTTETGYLIRYVRKDGGNPFYLHFNWGHEDDVRKGCVLGCHNRDVCAELFREWLSAHPDKEKFLKENLVEMVRIDVSESVTDTLNAPGEIEFVG